MEIFLSRHRATQNLTPPNGKSPAEALIIEKYGYQLILFVHRQAILSREMERWKISSVIITEQYHAHFYQDNLCWQKLQQWQRKMGTRLHRNDSNWEIIPFIMISQVEAFLCPDKQGTHEEGRRIQRPKLCEKTIKTKTIVRKLFLIKIIMLRLRNFDN